MDRMYEFKLRPGMRLSPTRNSKYVTYPRENTSLAIGEFQCSLGIDVMYVVGLASAKTIHNCLTSQVYFIKTVLHLRGD